MSLTVKASSGPKAPPLEAGSYAAVCVGLYDLGEQKTNFEGREQVKHQVVIQWELPDETFIYDGETRTRNLSKTYTASLHERSGLRKDLKSWRGREFTDAELEAFDLKNILGAPCLLQVVHKVTQNGTFANISGIMSLPKGMPKPRPTVQPTSFDIDTAALEELDTLPEWIKKKVQESITWQERLADYKNPENWPAEDRERFTDVDDGEELPF